MQPYNPQCPNKLLLGGRKFSWAFQNEKIMMVPGYHGIPIVRYDLALAKVLRYLAMVQIPIRHLAIATGSLRVWQAKELHVRTHSARVFNIQNSELGPLNSSTV